MDKKNISTKTATKALINGFVAYGVLVTFLFLVLLVLITYSINRNIKDINYDVLKYTLPSLGAFLIFFLVNGICRLSTFDLLKTCKIDKEKVDEVSGKMNLFFIGLIILSVLSIILFLSVKFNNEKYNTRKLIDSYNEQYSENFANYLTLEELKDFQVNRTNTIIQTVILETGLLLGIFSLIPGQKRLIEKYNDV